MHSAQARLCRPKPEASRRAGYRHRRAESNMPIGLLTLEIHLPDAHSLKDKRQVVRSLKDRLRAHFNVAVAELDGQDTWQRSVIGVVSVSSDEQYLQGALQKALDESERLLGRDLVGHEIEML